MKIINSCLNTIGFCLLMLENRGILVRRCLLGPRFAACVVCVLVALPTIAAEPASTSARNPNEMKIAYVEFSPFTFTNDEGAPDGMLIRMAETLFAKAGISWHATSYPAPRLYDNLQKGASHFALIVRNPDLADCCIYSKKPVWVLQIRAYYIGEKTPIKTKEDLIGKKIITLRGYSYAGMLSFFNDEKNRIENVLANSHDAAFKLLKAGRADYLLDYGGPADASLTRLQIADARYDTLHRSELFLVLSKVYPDAVNVMTRLESVARTINNFTGR